MTGSDALRASAPDGGQGAVAGNHKDGPTPEDARAYWRENRNLMLILLAIWFAVSFCAGILFRDVLDKISLGGAPLGFWFAQQGSIYVFVVLIFVYHFQMKRIERKYNISG